MDKRGKGVSRYSVENFCLTVAKIFVEEFITVAVILGTGNVGIRREREYQDIPSKIFCLTVPEKFRRGILYCCIKFV